MTVTASAFMPWDMARSWLDVSGRFQTSHYLYRLSVSLLEGLHRSTSGYAASVEHRLAWVGHWLACSPWPLPPRWDNWLLHFQPQEVSTIGQRFLAGAAGAGPPHGSTSRD